MSEKQLWMQRNINQLNIIGMYSTEKSFKLRLKLSNILLSLFVIPGLLDIVINCKTLENYIENFTSMLPTIVSIFFLVCFLNNRQKLEKLIDALRNNFILFEDSIKAELMILRLVRYSEYYVCFVFFVYILLCIQAYFEKEDGNIHDARINGLPVRTWYPLDLSKTINYSIIAIVQQVTIFVVVHISIPIAVCFASFLIHLRAQLFYLQKSLAFICDNEDHETSRILLKKIVKFHIILIYFAEKMQESFSSILLIHNYSPAVIISVCGYQASVMSPLDPKLLPYVAAVNYVLGECFVYCYFGQHIIDQSSLAGFVTYNTKWYNFPPDIVRDLKMIIMRCQKPLRLKFLGSTSASLDTYYNIVRTGYSYFMFLASMAKPKKI